MPTSPDARSPSTMEVDSPQVPQQVRNPGEVATAPAEKGRNVPVAPPPPVSTHDEPDDDLKRVGERAGSPPQSPVLPPRSSLSDTPRERSNEPEVMAGAAAAGAAGAEASVTELVEPPSSTSTTTPLPPLRGAQATTASGEAGRSSSPTPTVAVGTTLDDGSAVPTSAVAAIEKSSTEGRTEGVAKAAEKAQPPGSLESDAMKSAPRADSPGTSPSQKEAVLGTVGTDSSIPVGESVSGAARHPIAEALKATPPPDLAGVSGKEGRGGGGQEATKERVESSAGSVEPPPPYVPKPVGSGEGRASEKAETEPALSQPSPRTSPSPVGGFTALGTALEPVVGDGSGDVLSAVERPEPLDDGGIRAMDEGEQSLVDQLLASEPSETPVGEVHPGSERETLAGVVAMETSAGEGVHSGKSVSEREPARGVDEGGVLDGARSASAVTAPSAAASSRATLASDGLGLALPDATGPGWANPNLPPGSSTARAAPMLTSQTPGRRSATASLAPGPRVEQPVGGATANVFGGPSSSSTGAIPGGGSSRAVGGSTAGTTSRSMRPVGVTNPHPRAQQQQQQPQQQQQQQQHQFRGQDPRQRSAGAAVDLGEFSSSFTAPAASSSGSGRGSLDEARRYPTLPPQNRGAMDAGGSRRPGQPAEELWNSTGMTFPSASNATAAATAGGSGGGPGMAVANGVRRLSGGTSEASEVLAMGSPHISSMGRSSPQEMAEVEAGGGRSGRGGSMPGAVAQGSSAGSAGSLAPRFGGGGDMDVNRFGDASVVSRGVRSWFCSSRP